AHDAAFAGAVCLSVGVLQEVFANALNGDDAIEANLNCLPNLAEAALSNFGAEDVLSDVPARALCAGWTRAGELTLHGNGPLGHGELGGLHCARLANRAIGRAIGL